MVGNKNGKETKRRRNGNGNYRCTEQKRKRNGNFIVSFTVRTNPKAIFLNYPFLNFIFYLPFLLPLVPLSLTHSLTHSLPCSLALGASCSHSDSQAYQCAVQCLQGGLEQDQQSRGQETLRPGSQGSSKQHSQPGQEH